MNSMYSIAYIQAEHKRIDGKSCIHNTISLFRMIVMYSMNYIQTEHESVDGKMCIHTTSSLFRMYQNCKRLTSWPLSVRPDTITKQACNGHMLHLIIQKPCPEIGFIYFIFFLGPGWGLMVWREQVNYLYKGNAFWSLCSSDWVNIMASILPLALFLIDTFQLQSLQPSPLPANIQNAFSPSRL